MSWSLSVDATPAKDFGAAVDKAQAGGEVSKGIAGLQVTQAKAMLTALAASGALGEGTIGASVSGHGESPAAFTITVQEVDVPVAETAEAEAAEEAAEVEPAPVATVPPPVVGPPGQPGPAQTPGAVGGQVQPTPAVESAQVPKPPYAPPQ